MSRPFSQIVASRATQPERAVKEVVTRLERWKNQSGNARVTLDEVAWFGAVMALAGVKAEQLSKEGVTRESLKGVVNVVAEDSTSNVTDGVG
jgi:hypothetical protein